MNQNKQGQAILRVHPFPTLLAQSLQLADLARVASPGAKQSLAKSAIVFAAMSLECAATSCLELVKLPKGPHGKIERCGVLDKFDVLHWFATRVPLDRGRQVVQKIHDLIRVRNDLVHSRVRRLPFGKIREYVAEEGLEVDPDVSTWAALGIPKDEREWNDEHTIAAIGATVDFLNYFFLEACKLEKSKVAQMLCTSSGTVVFLTPWESQALSIAERQFGLKLHFLDR